MKPATDEGTWFALPLRSRGFAAGVVARTSPGGGVILAYFFKKLWDRPPTLGEVKGFRPEDAVRVLRVGDVGLMDGTWPVLGHDPDWRRGEWSVPQFVRKDDLSRRAWRVQYSDHDANLVESEAPTSFDTNLERDAVLGAGAAEVVLTRLVV
jgi:hypothetical protein